jgi:hypothetical protein
MRAMSRIGTAIGLSFIVLAGCGDDGSVGEGGVGDGGDADVPGDAGDAGDADGLDTGTPDTGAMDTGPDPRCPGPACPTDIIALDGYAPNQPCALRRNGELHCVEGAPDATSVFTPAGTFIGGREIARGARETCVLHDAHIVSCFRPGMAPYEVPELYDALDIDTWAQHTCVVRGPGGVTCWGDNASGQIEPGGEDSYPAMHDVPGVTEAARVATSERATCAVRRDGTVVCWGDDFGTMPTAVTGISDAVEITGGRFHFCATTSAGTVQCFGGTGAGTEAVAPDAIFDAEVAVAFEGESCYLDDTGNVSCWGVAGMPGQTEAQALESIVGLDDAVLLANHCALRESGVVTCWYDRDVLVDATGL